MLSVDEDYAARYKQCQSDVLHFATVKQLVKAGASGRGYAEEHHTFRGMPPRSLKSKLPMDEKLRDFRFFLLHAGPKPEYRKSNQLTLDRINTWKGYLLNNIAWTDKAQQTANRKTTKHHLVKGVKLTHSQLSNLLTKESGKLVPTERIKKRHQRGTSTEGQFAMEGVPYASGLSPRHNWTFPLRADAIAAMYQTSRRGRETRVDFYARTLREKIFSLRARIAAPKDAALFKQKQEAEARIVEYQHALRQVEKVLVVYDTLEFKEDLLPLLLPLFTDLASPGSSVASGGSHFFAPPVSLIEAYPGCGYTTETFELMLKEFENAKNRFKVSNPDLLAPPLVILIEAVEALPKEEQLALKEVAERHLARLVYLASSWCSAHS